MNVEGLPNSSALKLDVSVKSLLYMPTLKSNLGLQHGYGLLVSSWLTWAATAGQEWLCVATWSLDAAVGSGISVFRTLLLSLGYLSAFTAIVFQVSLVETTADKVT